MKACLFVLALLAGLVAQSSSVSADFTMWMNSGVARADLNAPLTVQPGPVPGSTRVTATLAGLHWLQIPLAVPSNVEIRAVRVCYQLTNTASFISQVRLTEMTTPNSAFAKVDDPTDLVSPTPACATSSALFTPGGSITLSLRLNFANTTDAITIGGVGLDVAPLTVAVPGEIHEPTSTMRQNFPNPVRASTTIQYELPHAAHVTLEVYSVTGQVVRRLVDRSEDPGHHHVVWDSLDDRGRDVNPGVYFYRVTMDGEPSGLRQMVVLR